MAIFFKTPKPIEMMLDVAIEEQSLEQENDSSWLICGKEGKGKSNTALYCVDYIDKKKGTKTPISHIASTLQHLIRILADAKATSTIVLDEGRKLASANVFDRLSRAISEAYTVMRKKRFITFICFTNPIKLQSYFKEDRTKGCFFIPKRGVVYYYSQSQIQMIINEMKRKNMTAIDSILDYEPRFICAMPKYEGELKEAYDLMKDENIEMILTELKATYGLEKTYSLSEATKVLGLSRPYLKKYIDANLLKATRSKAGKTIFIEEKELIRFKNNWEDIKQQYEQSQKNISQDKSTEDI